MGEGESRIRELQEALQADGASEANKELLWQVVSVCAGNQFETMKGLTFTYSVRGNELFVDRKEKSKSITRSSMDIALERYIALKQEGRVSYGPKKLKVFGASYIWGMFVRFGLIIPEE